MSTHASKHTRPVSQGAQHGTSTTSWSENDLPTPGYTGVLPRHLRAAAGLAASDQLCSSRQAHHSVAVAGMVASALRPHTSAPLPAQPSIAAGSGDVARPHSAASQAELPASAKQFNQVAAVASRVIDSPSSVGCPPWGVQGVEPPLAVPRAPRKLRAAVQGARNVHVQTDTDQEPHPGGLSPTRRQKRAIPRPMSESMPKMSAVGDICGDTTPYAVATRRCITPSSQSDVWAGVVGSNAASLRAATADAGLTRTGKGKARCGGVCNMQLW